MDNLLSREGEIQSMNAVDGDSITSDAASMSADFQLDSGKRWFFVHVPTSDDEGYLNVKTAAGNNRRLHFEKGDNPILIETVYDDGTETGGAANTATALEYRV